ncbi:acyltransferase [Vibrio mediterranei]|uniref:acyltransferase family protein n=1 Tax=Vibrio mediterranei TaxID=689 RepID=UPI00183D0387|nr:acyltransferase [Vibrio mediterranei]NUW74421.1 acyltransferase [Vibrio mediterranei]
MDKNNKLKSLEALRGIAALLVAIDHSILDYGVTFKTVPSELIYIAKFLGSFSVGVFFLLSGFVIFLNIHKSTCTNFLIKRAFRIYPVIAICILLGYLSKLSLGTIEFNMDSLKILLLNISLFGNFFIFNETNINPIIWTLAIEVKFYLIAALLLKVYKGRDLENNLHFPILAVSAIFTIACIYIRHIPMNSATVDVGVALTILPFMFIGTVTCYYYKSKFSYRTSMVLSIFY